MKDGASPYYTLSSFSSTPISSITPPANFEMCEIESEVESKDEEKEKPKRKRASNSDFQKRLTSIESHIKNTEKDKNNFQYLKQLLSNTNLSTHEKRELQRLKKTFWERVKRAQKMQNSLSLNERNALLLEENQKLKDERSLLLARIYELEGTVSQQEALIELCLNTNTSTYLPKFNEPSPPLAKASQQFPQAANTHMDNKSTLSWWKIM